MRERAFWSIICGLVIFVLVLALALDTTRGAALVAILVAVGFFLIDWITELRQRG